jgi:hypothetical protein
VLRDLHVKAGSPTVDNLKEHSDRSGHSVARSTLAGVLRGHGRLRWATVEAFVDACGSYAKARRQPLPPDAIDQRAWRERFDKAYVPAAREKTVAQAASARVPRRGTDYPLDNPAYVVPRYEIGGGVPGWKGPFQRAWNELMADGLWIGDPATAVYEEGPGVIQVFESHLSLFGWVLCALPHQRPVAVAGEVWHALQAAGAGVPGGDGLSALGFPAPDPAATTRIDTRARHVDLAGGQWGRGRLVRDAHGHDWRWEPEPRFEITMSYASGFWTAERAAQQLRVRALAVLPRADARELQITTTCRGDLEQALPGGEFAAQITALCRSRGAALAMARWVRGPNRNALDAFSYSSGITTLGGQVALSAEVMAALPNAMNSSVVTCAELRIENLAALADAVTATGATARIDMRLSIHELIDLLIVVWQTATETLAPVVVGTERPTTWAAPPTVELQVSAERRLDPNSSVGAPTLDTYVDLSPLGHSDRGPLSSMTVTVTAPPRLDRSARRSLTQQAVLYMAQQFGFVDLTEDTLQPARSSSR